MPVLRMSEEVARAIRTQGAESYPRECCGALLGQERGGSREVLDVVPLANTRHDSPQNRFSIAAEDVLAAERTARQRGLVLLGWYHSHPDHRAKPSEYDREHAWPWYSYVIVSVENHEAQRITAWRLANDRSRFDVEGLEIVGRDAAVAPCG